MNYVKSLGLLAAVVAALAVFASSALATTPTSNGTVYTGSFVATNEGEISLHGPNGITAECGTASIEGKVEAVGEGGTFETVLSSMPIGGCTNGNTFHVTTVGKFGYHWLPGWFPGNASLFTGSEQRLDMTAKTAFGTITCIYETKNTELGTLTGSATTGSTATMDLSGTVPRTGGSVLCGSTGTVTGSYIVKTPDNFNTDE